MAIGLLICITIYIFFTTGSRLHVPQYRNSWDYKINEK